MDSGLAGKRAVVTAGAGGIGRAIVESLMAAGARVHICDVDDARLAAVKEALPGLGGTLADVADPAAVDRLFDAALGALGGLDILVNNAGIAGPTAPADEISPENWRRTIAVDLDGAFHCARRAIPALKQAGGGSIVNIASTAGLFGFPNRSPYAAAKWGVIGLTKTLAMELGPYGIRVNAICPGSVAGPRMDQVIAADAAARGLDPADIREAYVAQVSMRTFVDAGDIANMALFVCSDAGAKISGQALAVDGHTETLTS
ncbi:MAG: SDR family oxidoreductase [Alphaproteobacteria bacterium]|nr:SDR family oxidoreductase [Alphaproteobacteria bacterium]